VFLKFLLQQRIFHTEKLIVRNYSLSQLALVHPVLAHPVLAHPVLAHPVVVHPGKSLLKTAKRPD